MNLPKEGYEAELWFPRLLPEPVLAVLEGRSPLIRGTGQDVSARTGITSVSRGSGELWMGALLWGSAAVSLPGSSPQGRLFHHTLPQPSRLPRAAIPPRALVSRGGPGSATGPGVCTAATLTELRRGLEDLWPRCHVAGRIPEISCALLISVPQTECWRHCAPFIDCVSGHLSVLSFHTSVTYVINYQLRTRWEYASSITNILKRGIVFLYCINN